MDVSRIFQLLDAGYSKEQIEAFEKGIKDSENDDKKPIEKPDDEQIEPPTEKTNNEQIEALQNEINKLTKTIQEMNTRNNTFEKPLPVNEKVDKILSDLWR